MRLWATLGVALVVAACAVYTALWDAYGWPAPPLTGAERGPQEITSPIIEALGVVSAAFAILAGIETFRASFPSQRMKVTYLTKGDSRERDLRLFITNTGASQVEAWLVWYQLSIGERELVPWTAIHSTESLLPLDQAEVIRLGPFPLPETPALTLKYKWASNRSRTRRVRKAKIEFST